MKGSKMKIKKRSKKKSKKQNRKLVRITLIILLIAAIGVVLTSYLLGPVENTDQAVVVEVPSGSSLDDIANLLEENNLVRSATVYKIYVKVQNKQSELKAGKYTFNTSMSSKELTDELIEGQPQATVSITIKEGLDLNRAGDYLEEIGLFTKDEFLAEIENNFDYYQQRYTFLNSVPEDRTYKLEGYLFGDTYEVYADATPQDVIIKMLDKFDSVFLDEYYARAEELNMTIDEIVTMASVVEREGILDEELPIIAGVFYNRLEDGMLLQSCATLQYIFQDYQFTFTSQQTKIDDPYNTYVYTGLPIGPISNFRESALLAALYPDENDYYYFCSKNDGTGSSAFAETLSEHQNNIDKYSENWD